MSADKVSKTPHVKLRLNRAGYDSLESLPGLLMQGGQHGVRGLADCNHENAAMRMKVVKIFADAQHAAFAAHMPLKS